MFNILKKSWLTYFIIVAYLAILVWYLSIRSSGSENNYLFNWSYGLIALVSALYSWRIATKYWGGLKSTMGKLIILLGVGLFSQWIGLQIWTYYNVIAKVEVPYPSLADIGYFGLVPAYVFAALMLSKVTGVRFSLRSLRGKLIILAIPVASLAAAFFLFVRNVGFEDSTPLRIFFDLAYPIGEIIPAAIALVILLLTTNIMGGRMRPRVLMLILAFSVQFFTEYFFLYQSGQGTYINGGAADLLYATSYAVMGLSLVSLSKIEVTE